MADIEFLYRQHLTEADRQLLAGVTRERESLSSALGEPTVEAAVFHPGEINGEGPAGFGEKPGWLAGTSPFLTFAVAVHRAAARLETAHYVEERWALRQRVPVFDVASLRDLLADPERRFFLVELLASYTHVTSGATWERTRRGWRRRRFSELDVLRLAELLEAVEPAERSGVYRRLGDLALFLTGVFPDHRAAFAFRPTAAHRLARAGGLSADSEDTGERPGNELLEELGGRWYTMASRTAEAHGSPLTTGLAVVRDIASHFGVARRVLNVVTDWYLFPLREGWFGAG